MRFTVDASRISNFCAWRNNCKRSSATAKLLVEESVGGVPRTELPLRSLRASDRAHSPRSVAVNDVYTSYTRAITGEVQIPFITTAVTFPCSTRTHSSAFAI